MLYIITERGNGPHFDVALAFANTESEAAEKVAHWSEQLPGRKIVAEPYPGRPCR